VISPPKTIETQRLRLRKPRLADAEVIFREYASDAEVTKYVSWRAHRSAAETREYVRTCLAGWEARKVFHWVIERKNDRHLMGMITARVDDHKWEMGYVLSRPNWGRGYMTEAVKGVIDWALKQPQIFRIWAVCDVDNLASARVMEKAGMQREGRLCRWSVHPNISVQPRDSYCFSITK
jgi:ribosomal-protein-alanine N-acetyltransferase